MMEAPTDGHTYERTLKLFVAGHNNTQKFLSLFLSFFFNYDNVPHVLMFVFWISLSHLMFVKLFCVLMLATTVLM